MDKSNNMKGKNKSEKDGKYIKTNEKAKHNEKHETKKNPGK